MPVPKDALAAVPLFAGVDATRVREIAAGAPVRTVAAGTVVARRGEPARSLIVVEIGTLSGTYETAAGQRLRFGEWRGPCAVDKVAVLDGGAYTATWQASTQTRLRLVSSAVLMRLIDDVPAARRHVLRHLAEQVRSGRDELVRAAFSDATSRVAAWLIQAADGAGTRVLLPGAQAGLGEAVGVTRVSVNRALRTLSREGLIRVELGAVVVLAPELLAQRAR